MADSAKPKRFRLSLVNAAEDVPRMVRAYGRACMGEFALVLRPREQRGVLVLMTKKEGARAWQAGDADAPGVPTATLTPEAAVKLLKDEQKGLPKAGPITLRGQWSGWLYCDEGAPRVELTRKLAAYGVLTISSVAGQGWAWKVARTEKWFSKPGADEGNAPTLLAAVEAGLRRAMGLLGEACSLRDSSRRAAYDSGFAAEHPIRPAREGKDPTEKIKARPVKATGWTHFLHDDDAPESEEINKPTKAQRAMLAQAGLELDPEAGTFFGRTTEAWGGYPVGSLVYREAHDNGFHVGPVSKGRGRRKAASPAPVDAPLALPDVPETPAALQRMADQVTAEADALAELRSRRWVWEEADTAAEVQQWFAEHGLDHEAGEVAAFIANPWDGATFLADLRRGLEHEEPDTRQVALAQVERLEAWWIEAPQLMARARQLIRYAARMAESKLCKGREKREAVEALQRAIQAYDEARDAIRAGKPVDGVLTLRRIGERVALSAAKSARSCALGQQSLTAAAKKSPERKPFGGRGESPVRGLQIVPVGVAPTTAEELRILTAGHARAFTEDPTAANGKKWAKSALGHLGLQAESLSAKSRSFEDLGGGKRIFVSVVLPAKAEGDDTDRRMRLVSEAAPKGLSVEDWDYGTSGAVRASRGARPAAARAAESAGEPVVDAAKDKALLDAFSAAIATAMQGA